MHKNATKCNETIGKWCKNKHGASKIIDTFETYQPPIMLLLDPILDRKLRGYHSVEDHIVLVLQMHQKTRVIAVHPSGG
jgi:hypothetical protein